MSTVIIEGNVVADPVLKYLEKSGMAVVELAIAENRSFTRGTDRIESVSYTDVTVWDQMAENVAATVKKGMRVMVEARLEQVRWETEDGQTRSKHRLIANGFGVSLRWATAVVERNPRRVDDAIPEDIAHSEAPAPRTPAKAKAKATVPAGAPADDNGEPF